MIGLYTGHGTNVCWVFENFSFKIEYQVPSPHNNVSNGLKLDDWTSQSAKIHKYSWIRKISFCNALICFGSMSSLKNNSHQDILWRHKRLYDVLVFFPQLHQLIRNQIMFTFKLVISACLKLRSFPSTTPTYAISRD